MKSDKRQRFQRGSFYTQYAYRAIENSREQSRRVYLAETKYGKEVVGTTLEHCTISFCSRVAAYLAEIS